ncbi:hypothetical protein JQX13_38500 [Archangium violaceum]|uniref:hypothetical protein n=1 Tax=Archangium violaceum TaxID=83451 RepID=UPI00193C6661|nr:hypothetical protein [Archangium violaceum]QRK05978.1 hypothetical protein JQX13_38500 [Archangium violaceum]
MLHTVKSGPIRLLVLLAALQAGCLLESEPPIETAGKCGPRDLSPECCLKEFPGQWERCTGASTYSTGIKVIAAGVAVTVALNPVIDAAERRGVELAADLLAKVEKAIVQCVRKADQEVNDYHFNGRSPCPETNPAVWSRYMKGPWLGRTQGDVYKQILHTDPNLVSPRHGVEKWSPE